MLCILGILMASGSALRRMTVSLIQRCHPACSEIDSFCSTVVLYWVQWHESPPELTLLFCSRGSSKINNNFIALAPLSRITIVKIRVQMYATLFHPTRINVS